MAVQDKKVIGDKPGFVVPQKGVNFNPNQKNQGGSGGAASSANPSGLSKKPNEYKPPASARYNAATEDPIGISNKLEAGAKAVSDLPKTIGSTLIDAAKGTGNAIVGAGVGLANMAASDGSMRSTPKYNVDDVKNKIGSIVDSAITPSNYTSVVTNGLSRMGIGSKESTPVPSSNVTAPSEIISDRQNEVAQQASPVQLGGRLNNELNSLSPVTSDVVSEGVAKGEFARSSGGTTYARSEDGSIFRKGTDGSLSKLGGISSIGPNGTNSDGSPLSARDQAALDRSNQMISDWKAHKEEARFNSLIAGRPASSQLSAIAVRNKDLTDRYQVDASRESARLGAENQARQLAAVGRKNTFDEAKGTAELGFKQSENLLKAREQIFKERSEAQKAWAESSKNMDSPLAQLTKYQSLGQTVTPDIARAAYEGDLSGIDNKEDYVQKLGQLLKENKINKQVADMLVVDYDTQR